MVGVVQEDDEEGIGGTGHGDSPGGMGDCGLLSKGVLGVGDALPTLQVLHFHHRPGGVVYDSVGAPSFGAGKGGEVGRGMVGEVVTFLEPALMLTHNER